MKIALLGIPGSGKTVLAATLRDQLNENADVIDHYAEDVAERGDYAIGLEGGWLASVTISTERYARERGAKKDTVITCGTLLESSVYTMMHFEEMSEFYTEQEKENANERINTSMRFFANLYLDTFRYDKAFYLPPLNAPDNDRFKVLDQNVQAAFGAFNLIPVEPLEGDTAQRADTVLSLAKVGG